MSLIHQSQAYSFNVTCTFFFCEPKCLVAPALLYKPVILLFITFNNFGSRFVCVCMCCSLNLTVPLFWYIVVMTYLLIGCSNNICWSPSIHKELARERKREKSLHLWTPMDPIIIRWVLLTYYQPSDLQNIPSHSLSHKISMFFTLWEIKQVHTALGNPMHICLQRLLT